MIKILVVHGSPHQGQTHAATMDFLEELGKRVAIEAKHVFLSQERLELCRGCGTCVTQGENGCPNKDGLAGVHAAIEASEAVILTSPVYALQVTALVKNFLDRSAYVMHRPRCFGKRFMSVSTQYYSGDRDVEKYLASVMRFWGFGVLPGLRLTMTWGRERVASEIGAAAGRFQEAMKKNAFPAPTLKEMLMFRFRRTAMGTKGFADTFPRDVEYYREKGWHIAPYYYDVKLSPLMSAAGSVFDAVGRRLIK